MDNKSIHFSIPLDKKEYDLRFDEIKRIPSHWSPKRITKAIFKKLSLSIILARPLSKEILDTIPIYRLRVMKDNEKIDELDLKEFIYPPKRFCVMQRCNRSKQQVFYASGDPHSPFLELAESIKPGTVGYVSKWGIRGDIGKAYMRYFFYGIPEDEKSYASVMACGIQEAFQKIFKQMPDEPKNSFSYCQELYQQLFTSKGKDYYHITSSIVNEIFGETRKKNPEFNIPAIAYPSVAKDKEAVNFVFRKDFVDEFFYLKYIDKVIVNSVSKEKVNFTPIGRAIIQDDKIKWLNFAVKVDKIHYDGIMLSRSKNPSAKMDLISVKKDKKILSCCPKHFFTPQEYLKEKKFNESMLLEAIKDIPQHGLESELTGLRQHLVFVPVDEKLYYNKDYSKKGKINIVGIPVTYKLEYSV